MSEFIIYSSCPMDYFEGYTHVSEISDHLERYIRTHVRCNETFLGMWTKILDKLYWAWTKCKYIDLDLRQPDFWVRIMADGEFMHDIAVIFKADNNGTIYAILNNKLDIDLLVSCDLFHEFGGEWTRETPKSEVGKLPVCLEQHN